MKHAASSISCLDQGSHFGWCSIEKGKGIHVTHGVQLTSQPPMSAESLVAIHFLPNAILSDKVAYVVRQSFRKLKQIKRLSVRHSVSRKLFRGGCHELHEII